MWPGESWHGMLAIMWMKESLPRGKAWAASMQEYLYLGQASNLIPEFCLNAWRGDGLFMGIDQ